MSIKLEISKNISNFEKDLQIHYIPVNSNGNGPADVKNQFEQYTISDDNEVYLNSVRGIPLKGKKTKIPEGYTGVCFQETRQSFGENNTILKTFATFDNFTYWNYDKLPNKGDPFHQAVQICNVSEEICKPVSMEDIENHMKSKKSENK